MDTDGVPLTLAVAQALGVAIDRVLEEDGDDYFVFLLSDANLGRYPLLATVPSLLLALKAGGPQVRDPTKGDREDDQRSGGEEGEQLRHLHRLLQR